MSIVTLKHQAVPDQTSRTPKGIRRTPGHEHFVTGDDIAQPLAGDTETKRPQPKSTSGKPRLCLFPCGRFAAKADLFCEPCRLELNRDRRAE